MKTLNGRLSEKLERVPSPNFMSILLTGHGIKEYPQESKHRDKGAGGDFYSDQLIKKRDGYNSNNKMRVPLRQIKPMCLATNFVLEIKHRKNDQRKKLQKTRLSKVQSRVNFRTS